MKLIGINLSGFELCKKSGLNVIIKHRIGIFYTKFY